MRKADRLSRHHAYSRTWHHITAVAALLTLAGACGKSSDSEVRPDGSAGTTGAAGTTGSAGASGSVGAAGASGVAGSQAGTGGSGTAATGGSGTAGTGGASANCAPRAAFTEASHSILQVKWDAGTATSAGTGVVHVWAKTAWTANGNNLAGTVKACGSVLPPASLTQLVGGGMILIEIPNSAWEAAGMPTFQVTGTQTGWNVGSMVSNNYAVMIGYTMANGATADWPMSYTGITMTVDSDGDMNPGLTSVPRNGGGYVLPPTSALGAILGGARADKVYLVTRNVATNMMTRTSCDESSGTATFMHFDNHVVGCHVSGGGECKSDEVAFIDTNRTQFQVMSATIETKVVADTATCADVRTALPM
jgi:hypothetical protein